jgi:hypothetical protein
MDTLYRMSTLNILCANYLLKFNVLYLPPFLLQTSFFLRFMEAHPECNIRQRAFERLKPSWVKKLKERNTCCCIYHVEMDMMKAGLITLRDKLRGFYTLTNCNCLCVVCAYKK